VKKIVMYVVVGVIALAVVVGAGGLTAYLVSDQRAKAAAEAAVKATPAGTAKAESEAKTLSPEKVTPDTTVELKPFTTNLADTDRTSYINVTFQLVLANSKDKKKIEEKLPLVRDTVLQVLNKKQSMEVTGADAANKLKNDVLEGINAVLGGHVVEAVLISDKVVQ
jgi:flagellar FliL protein